MFISYPTREHYLSIFGLRPTECSQAEHLHRGAPSSFHHKATTAGQQSSTELDLVHPEAKTVSDRSTQETRKSYLCSYEWCGKKFQREHSRRVHERTIHLNEKPFQCHICEKKFAQKSDARKHLQVHSGAKPYICLTCKRAFSQSSNMYTHIRKQHKIVPKKHDNWIKSWLA